MFPSLMRSGKSPGFIRVRFAIASTSARLVSAIWLRIASAPGVPIQQLPGERRVRVGLIDQHVLDPADAVAAVVELAEDHPLLRRGEQHAALVSRHRVGVHRGGGVHQRAVPARVGLGHLVRLDEHGVVRLVVVLDVKQLVVDVLVLAGEDELERRLVGGAELQGIGRPADAVAAACLGERRIFLGQSRHGLPFQGGAGARPPTRQRGTSGAAAAAVRCLVFAGPAPDVPQASGSDPDNIRFSTRTYG